jgi:photosystem II stability/assembly factor-like uncharacterized protein
VGSGDGGATWTGLPSGTFQDLSVVQELSPSVVVVGGGCAVRESINGGASFIDVPINASEDSCQTNVASLSFLDQNIGYVELQDGSILFTNNAGQTVQSLTPAPVGGGQGNDLHFVSSTTGFAVSGPSPGRVGGGLIERTTDSANSWTEVGSSANGLNAITFVNPSTAFAVGNDNTLLESTDGGSTWKPQPLALPAGAGPFNLEHISCSSPTTCLITTADGKELIRTVDGARTGTIVNPSSQVLTDVAFSTGTNVIGVGQDGATVLSADAGQTFSSVYSSRFSFAFSTNGVGLRAGAAAGHAYSTGDGGQIAATTNGGASWSILRVPTSSDIGDIAFPTASTGYALDQDGFLHKTTNGGVSWSSLNTGVSNPSALATSGAKTVLLIGPGVNRSTDGGNNFRSVQTKVAISTKPKRTMKLSKFALSESQTIRGAILAWGNRLIESTTSGRTWRSIPLPLAHRSLNDVSFVSPTTGYVLQGGFRVFFTRNRGRKWTEIESVGVPSLGGISFSSARTGYVEENGPVNNNFGLIDVLHTTNGGRTWQPEIIAGQGGQVLATPGFDYFTSGVTFSGAPSFTGFFSTTNGGASPQKSSLSISIGPKKLTPARLKKAGHQIKVKGKLRPVTNVGEMVQIAHRTLAGSWATAEVRVASNGAFSFTIHGVRKTTEVVALALGDGVHGGAGTPAARLTVTRARRAKPHRAKH